MSAVGDARKRAQERENGDPERIPDEFWTPDEAEWLTGYGLRGHLWAEARLAAIIVERTRRLDAELERLRTGIEAIAKTFDGLMPFEGGGVEDELRDLIVDVCACGHRRGSHVGGNWTCRPLKTACADECQQFHRDDS